VIDGRLMVGAGARDLREVVSRAHVAGGEVVDDELTLLEQG